MKENFDYENDSYDWYNYDYWDYLIPFPMKVKRYSNKEIEKGDLVKVVDWSYSLSAKDLKAQSQQDYIDNEYFKPKYCTVFKVIKFNKFPIDQFLHYSFGIQRAQQNDTLIQNIETKETFFIRKDFLRIPILFKKF